MSNVIPMPNASESSNDIMDNACDWIAKIDRGLSEKETKQFQQWLFMSPQHMETMMEVAQFWDKLEELNRLAQVVPENLVVKDKASKWPVALAASVLLMCSMLFFQLGEESAPKYVAVEKSYSTQVGEKNTIHLPDSSVLVLNTNSLVDIRYTQEARIIELQQGELHVEVAHDKQRPLSVVAGGKVIQAVGTAFNVEYHQKTVELIVTDGKVLVATLDRDKKADTITRLPSQSLAVSKGQKVDLQTEVTVQEQQVEVVEAAEITSELSWQKGKLIFRGDKLADAMAEIERYTEYKILLDDDAALRDIKIAGMFKTGDVENLLSVLESSFNVEHEEVSQNTIKLKRKG